MHILTASQMHRLDEFTILNEPISPIDLMERAAKKCFEWFNSNIGREIPIVIFCGPGNNGGDGLALTRLLNSGGYKVKAIVFQMNGNLSFDCKLNLEKLQIIDFQLATIVNNNFKFPNLKPTTILVDALFGTGISRNLNGEFGEVVKNMNASLHPIISIDLPSGLYSDKSSINNDNQIIKSTITLTFHCYKTALLISENAPFFGHVVILDIGLLPDSFPKNEIQHHLIDNALLHEIYVPKWEFSHKGNFGHALLITGEKGKMGAAILCAGGFLRSGGGLLTLLVPKEEIAIAQVAVPEAMVFIAGENSKNGDLPSLEQFKVAGIGPGIGTSLLAITHLKNLLNGFPKPIVLDADALNILSAHPQWLASLPPDSILTPHPGEFQRLVGDWKNDFDKFEKQLQFAQKHHVFLILKGKNTSIATPNGKMYFNPTGNSGMAKGGSGDVLTGLLTGILASGYSSLSTCLLGVYIHGLAGDLAAIELSKEGMKAGDIIDFIPEAWKKTFN